jgi:hypothetical protein
VKRTVLKRLAVYKTKPFARFAHKARISDSELWETAWLANSGAIDANLGGGVIKQRIARAGEGKSGGSRAIILFRFKTRLVFVHGLGSFDSDWTPNGELKCPKNIAAT